MRIPQKTNARDFSIERLLLRNRGARESSLQTAKSKRERKKMNILQERTITINLYQYYQGLLEEVYREFLDTYELDWGNIGIYFHEQTAICVVNAPQHLQLSLEFELYAFILDYPIEELEKLGREEKKAELQDALCGHFIDAYSQLDIESYFDEVCRQIILNNCG